MIVNHSSESCEVRCDSCDLSFGTAFHKLPRVLRDAAGHPLYVLNNCPEWRGKTVNHLCHACLGKYLADFVQQIETRTVFPGGVSLRTEGMG